MLTEYTRVNGKCWREAKKVAKDDIWYGELLENEKEMELYEKLTKVQEEYDARTDLTND